MPLKLPSFIHSPKPFQAGDVLTDVTTVLAAVEAVTGCQVEKRYYNGYNGAEVFSPTSADRVLSLAHLVEMIVLNNGVFVDGGRHLTNGQPESFASALSIAEDVLGDIVHPVHVVDSQVRAELEAAAHDSLYKDDMSDVARLIAEAGPQLLHALHREANRMPYASRFDIDESPSAILNRDIRGLAMRALYYLGLANVMGVPYVPHVLRAPIILKHLSASLQPTRPRRFANIATTTVWELADARIDEMNRKLGSAFFALDTPIVFNLVIQRVKRKRDILSAALQLRDTKEATAFRKVAAQFDEAVEMDELKAIQAGLSELNQHARRLREVQGEEPSSLPSLQVGFPPSIAFDPVMALRLVSQHRKRHLIFISQLYDAAVMSRGFWGRYGSMPW